MVGQERLELSRPLRALGPKPSVSTIPPPALEHVLFNLSNDKNEGFWRPRRANLADSLLLAQSLQGRGDCVRTLSVKLIVHLTLCWMTEFFHSELSLQVQIALEGPLILVPVIGIPERYCLWVTTVTCLYIAVLGL